MSWPTRKLAKEILGSLPTSTYQEVRSSRQGGGGGGGIGIVVKNYLRTLYKNFEMIFDLSKFL